MTQLAGMARPPQSPGEAGILGVEALDERAALGAVGEELRPALDDHATDVAAAGPGRLGDHDDAWIAPRAHPPRGGETASRVRSPMFS